MNAKKTYDLIVIGGGSGGVRMARWSGGLGAKVAICESDRYGGTCVIRGCIPKKFMVYASEFRSEMEMMRSYGWDLEAKSFDWHHFKQVRDREIERLSGLYGQMLTKNKVDCYQGEAKLIGPNEVQVGVDILSAKTIVIATGSKPSLPSIPGVEHAKSSNEIFHLDQLPKSMVVMGAGYIGLEFASIFHGLGCEVHVFFRKDQILNGFDRESCLYLQQELIKKGIKLYPQSGLSAIKAEAGKFKVSHASGADLICDQVLLATGRVPNTAELNLKQLGIETKQSGAIVVNKYFQTSLPHIYALGDCIDMINLTPVATNQATLLAENLFNKKQYEFDADLVPSAVFTTPAFASVGLSEEQAIKQHTSVDIYTSNFRPLKYALTQHTQRTFIKLIVDKKSNKVLGAHMVGTDAPEIIQGLAIAIKAGATKADFDRTIGIHPSSAEEFVTLRTKRAD